MGTRRGHVALANQDEAARGSSGRERKQHAPRSAVRESTGIALGLDDHGRIIHVSASARAVLGARTTDLLGLSIADLAIPEDRVRLGWWLRKQRDATDAADQIPPVAFRVERRYGLEVGAVARALPPTTAGEAAQFGVDLIEGSDGVPENPYLQLVALRERIDQLDRSNRQLETLVATAAHDLKSPVASVAATVELLVRHAGPALDERSQQLVGDVLRGVGQLSHLVDGLLRCSLAGVRLDIEVADGDELVADTVRELRAELDAAEAMVTVTPIGPIVADLEQLRSVFRNLLTNAVRHRSEDRPLRIWIDVHDAPAARTFTVSDNGPGIVPAERERLFRMFERLDRRTPGSGIGLATCQRIIEAHGGRIWLNDATGGGTAVCFTLPAQRLLGI